MCCVSVLCGRTVRDSYQTDLCLRACGSDRGRYRHHTVRLHPAEHHVQVRLPTVAPQVVMCSLLLETSDVSLLVSGLNYVSAASGVEQNADTLFYCVSSIQ